MSAQHECFCLTMVADSSGTTGVKAARLIARKANSSRAVNVIARTLSHLDIFERTRASRRTGLIVLPILNDGPDFDLVANGCRADYDTGLRFGSDLHCFRFTSAKGVQAWLLREQIVLRDFNQENCAGFATVC